MVTSLVEAGRQKCHLYYPHIVGRSHTYQEFTVNCYKVDDEDDWVVTFLRLTNTKTSGAVSAELFRLFFLLSFSSFFFALLGHNFLLSAQSISFGLDSLDLLAFSYCFLPVGSLRYSNFSLTSRPSH